MRLKARWLIPVSSLLVLLGSLLYYIKKDSSTNFSALSTDEESGPWLGRAAPISSLARGEQWVYALEYSGSGALPEPEASPLEFSVRGLLHIAVLGEEGDRLRVWLGFTPDPAALADLPAGLRPLLQETWERGVGAWLGKRAFHLQISEQAELKNSWQTFWSVFAERTRMDLPSRFNADSWFDSEISSSGTLAVRYKIESATAQQEARGAELKILKSYDTSVATGKTMKGETHLSLHSNSNGLIQLKATRDEREEANGQSLSAHSELSLKLLRVETVEQSRLLAFEQKWAAAPRRDATLDQEQWLQKQALGGSDLSELWLQVQNKDLDGQQELYLKLKAWVYLHPLELDAFMQRLQPLDDEDPALRLGIRALAGAGHAAAQTALLGLLKERRDSEGLARKIITTLSFMGAATPATQQALEKLSQDPQDSGVRRSSRLALGIVGQRLQKDPSSETRARVLSIEQWALDQLLKADTVPLAREALAVLGNFGPTDRSSLEPWLSHSDIELRAQAYFALRFARALDTPQFLALRYEQNEAETVRRQIVQALLVRPVDENWLLGLEALLVNRLPDTHKTQLASALVRSSLPNRQRGMQLLLKMLETATEPAVKASLAQYRLQYEQSGA